MTEGTDSNPKEPLDVLHLVMAMTEQMASVAWQKMGLQPDLMSGAIAKDIEQARIAIDATSALASVLEERLDEEDKRRLHSLLRDLKINFVQHSAGGDG